jgi:hypothetical protein
MGRYTEGDTLEETHRLAHTPQDIDGTLIGQDELIVMAGME